MSYVSYRQQVASYAQSNDDYTALSYLPIQTNEPVTSRPNMWVTFPNLRTLGYGLPHMPQDSTIYINFGICNFDQVRIDPNK